MSEYRDRLIQCTDSAVLIRGYYFPWGTKRIPYSSIESLERFDLSTVRGKWRIWGSGDFTHWANLDLQRPKKDVGFFMNVGKRVVPFLTPDDPDTFERVVRSHANLGGAN